MPRHTTPRELDLAADLRVKREKASDPRRCAEIDEMIAATPKVRYCPLSGFGSADYVEYYIDLLESSGAFETLKYSTAELNLSRDKFDLAGFAALGSAFATLLTKAKKDAKTLRTLVVDHCQRFRVQVYSDDLGAWVNLYTDDANASAAAAIDEHLDFGQMIDLVRALAGGVLRPLWSRLRSSGEETLDESAKHSINASPES